VEINSDLHKQRDCVGYYNLLVYVYDYAELLFCFPLCKKQKWETAYKTLPPPMYPCMEYRECTGASIPHFVICLSQHHSKHSWRELNEKDNHNSNVQYIQVWGCNSFYFLLGHQFPELHCN